LKYANRNDRQILNRLQCIVQENRAFSILKQIEKCKIELSNKDIATFDDKYIDIKVQITRNDLYACLKPIIQQIDKELHTFFTLSKLHYDDIDIVIKTGGSSLLHAISKYLESKFSCTINQYDTFTSIASGLAIVDYKNNQ
jgi:hypothetical chaperone protein